VRFYQQLFDTFTTITVRLPYQEGGLISLFHELGQVERVEHSRSGVLIQGGLPGRLLARYQPFVSTPRGALDAQDEISGLNPNDETV